VTATSDAGDVVSILALEQIEQDLYRANYVVREDRPLFGGQVAAQALAAAGATVPPQRLPHSLHGYFLRPGDSHRPTLFQVERDRTARCRDPVGAGHLQHGGVVPAAPSGPGGAGHRDA
jgi:acyl-CoA thioesterase-2